MPPCQTWPQNTDPYRSGSVHPFLPDLSPVSSAACRIPFLSAASVFHATYANRKRTVYGITWKRISTILKEGRASDSFLCLKKRGIPIDYIKLIEEVRAELLQVVNQRCDDMIQMYQNGDPYNRSEIRSRGTNSLPCNTIHCSLSVCVCSSYFLLFSYTIHA